MKNEEWKIGFDDLNTYTIIGFTADARSPRFIARRLAVSPESAGQHGCRLHIADL
jgi:hypothetical protein